MILAKLRDDVKLGRNINLFKALQSDLGRLNQWVECYYMTFNKVKYQGHNNCMEQYRLGEDDWKIAMIGH